MVLKSKPAFGTKRDSIWSAVPTNKISLSGYFSLIYEATARAGLIWPAVPPVANNIFILTPIPFVDLFFLKQIELLLFQTRA